MTAHQAAPQYGLGGSDDPGTPRSTSRTPANVWIVNHYAFPPDQAAGTRNYDLARRLVARGDQVTIFAAGFSHLTGHEERLPSARLSRNEWFNGVRFVWLRTTPYRGNTWRRKVNMLSYLAVFLVVQTRSKRPDVIVGVTVHPFAALAGWIAAKARRARFVFEIGDLWPQTLVDLGAMREGSPGERLLRSLEAFLVTRASAVVTLLPGIRDYLAERGLRADHVAYVPNGVDLEAFDAELDSPLGTSASASLAMAEATRLRGEGRFVVGYVGSFGRVNRVDVIIDAAISAERCAPGRLGVVIVGDGPDRAALVRRAAGSPAVTVCGAVPKRFVPSVLRAMDALVVHTTATPVYRYGISFNKLFEYMAAARPVVFACRSAYDPVASEGAGLTIEPDDREAMASAFLELIARDPEERAAMGAAGREYVAREHNIDHLGEKFAKVIDGLVAAPAP